MSVVNKMLQDLEARQQASDAPSANYQPTHNGRSHTRWLLSLLLLVCVSLGVYFWYVQSAPSPMTANQSDIGATQPQAPDTTTTTAVNEVSDPVQTETADTAAMQAQLQPQESEVHGDITEIPAHGIGKQVLTSAADNANQEEELDAKVDHDQTTTLSAENTPVPLAADTSEESTAVSQAPGEAPLAAPQGTLSVSGSQADSDPVYQREQVRLALASGKHDQAAALLSQLVGQFPDDKTLLKQWASALFASGQADAADTVLRTGLQRFAGDGELVTMLARVVYARGEAEQALSLLNQPAYANALSLQGMAFRASLAQETHAYVQAKRDYQQLLRQQPESSQWWLGLAVVEERLQQPQAALSAYRRVLTLQQLPTDVLAFAQQRVRVLSEGS